MAKACPQIEEHRSKRVGSDHHSAQVGRNSERLQITEKVVEDRDIAVSHECYETQAQELKGQKLAMFSQMMVTRIGFSGTAAIAGSDVAVRRSGL